MDPCIASNTFAGAHPDVGGDIGSCKGTYLGSMMFYKYNVQGEAACLGWSWGDGLLLRLQVAARSYLHMQSYTSPPKSFSAMNEFLIIASFSTSHLHSQTSSDNRVLAVLTLARLLC